MAWSCAFFIFAAATNCMALVIWAVFLTDLIRRRMSRVEGIYERMKDGIKKKKPELFPACLKVFEARLEIRFGVFEGTFVSDLVEKGFFA